MEKQAIIPTFEKVKEFLKNYDWNYREVTTDENKKLIISNVKLEDVTKGILVSFNIEGEYLLVSTVDFLKEVPNAYSKRLLILNDTLKLVKLFAVYEEKDTLDAELGFELWNESFNEATFYAFMDMLCIGINDLNRILKEEQIPHKTSFVTYQ